MQKTLFLQNKIESSHDIQKTSSNRTEPEGQNNNRAEPQNSPLQVVSPLRLKLVHWGWALHKAMPSRALCTARTQPRGLKDGQQRYSTSPAVARPRITV